MSDPRSFERITKTDLKKLARIARAEREEFFDRHPEWALLYRKRLVCSVLCRDAALHFVNGVTGIEQFQVWSFYAAHAEAAFPFQHMGKVDFGPSRFGRDPNSEAYKGRRVELTGRSLDCRPSDDPIVVIQQYLKEGDTPSARELRDKAVVLLEPDNFLGYVAWPSLVMSAAH